MSGAAREAAAVAFSKPLRFTREDAERASDAWGANCGPGAIAAVMSMTLDELRPHLGDFEAKRYMNPTHVKAALCRLGARYRVVYPPAGWPSHGFAFVQWDGPWTAPGAPVRAAYRHTHWVAARRTSSGAGVRIFDINAMDAGGWIPESEWIGSVVPWLLEDEPKASGRWRLKQAIEIEPRGRPDDGELVPGSTRGQMSEPGNQGELLETPEPAAWRPSPEKVRARLHRILAQARQAQSAPWEPGRASLYRTIFPQLCRYLPDDEALQLQRAFDSDMARLFVAQPRSSAPGPAPDSDPGSGSGTSRAHEESTG